MNTSSGIEVTDVHYAQESPLADALGKLQWEGQIIWFHNFGLTHIGEHRHLLRIGLPEQRSGSPSAFTSILVSIFTPGGLEISHQEFPFYNYDKGKGNAAKQLSLAFLKDKYTFVIGAGVSGASPRDASDQDLRRLDGLCTAVFRWAMLMAGGKLPDTKRHHRPANALPVADQAIAAGSASVARRPVSTDSENIVVLDDEVGHPSSDAAAKV